MGKYVEVVSLLEKRIRHGDYALRDMPPERQLAEEVGVSRRTVRRAVQQLIDAGLLVRQPNGRTAINRTTHHDRNGAGLQIAFLAPTQQSADIQRTKMGLDALTARSGGACRPILYSHWDDTQILDALDGFDGIFLYPLPEPMPQWLIGRLRGGPCPTVIVGQDTSQHGLRSVRFYSPTFVHRVLDHFAELGHRHIDCLTTKLNLPSEEQIIEQWQIWRTANQIKGRLISDPDGSAMQSYQTMCRLLKAGEFSATALFCVTMPATVGALRAFYEHGMQVGRDVSVATLNGEGVAQYLCPSITSIDFFDIMPYLTLAYEWIAEGGKNWHGPLLLQPQDVRLFKGESTAPPRQS